MTLRILPFLCLLLLLTGCFETKDEFVLNPDGSGKLIHEAYFQPINLSDNQSSSSDAKLKQEIAKILEDSEGVEAWSDVTYKLAEDGRMFFRGTAYFRDLSKLKIDEHWSVKLKMEKDPSGKLVVEALSSKDDEDDTDSETKPETLSEAEVTQKIKEQRAQFQQMKPMMVAMMGKMNHTLAMQIPGQIESHTNFQIIDGKITLNFDGAKMVEAMEKLIGDDRFMRGQVQSGQSLVRDGVSDQEVINEALFGTKGPIRAVIAPSSKSAFDYKGEVARAKADFEGIRKDLGLVKTILAPAKGGSVKSIAITGARLVTPSESQDMRAFNYEPGLTFAMRVEFPGSVVDLEGTLESAITDTGTDLCPKREWDRKFHFPKFSDDKGAALVELEMEVPGADVNGFKEITGNLEYTVAGGTRQVDLGFSGLKEKNAGKELQATIEKIGTGFGGKDWEIRIKMHSTPQMLQSMKLVTAAGEEFVLERGGYGGGGGVFSFTFKHKSPIPEDGKLIAELFDELEKIKTPFKIENIDLLGRPR